MPRFGFVGLVVCYWLTRVFGWFCLVCSVLPRWCFVDLRGLLLVCGIIYFTSGVCGLV